MNAPKICSVESCGNPARRKGMCDTHRRRLEKYGDPFGGPPPLGAPMKYLMDVAVPHVGTECVPWPFGRGYVDGRAKVNFKNKTVYAARLVCTLIHGDPPTPDHEAAHSCGKGHEGCVAGNHISWKTRIENANDKILHGTKLLGEKNPFSKLTQLQVDEIKSLRGVKTQRELGRIYNVNPATIWAIFHGKTWK